MHTIRAFYQSDLNPEIILVLNAGFFNLWKDLCIEHNFNIPHRLVENGDQRFHSVKNGLEFVEDNSIVAVHDGVRPIVSNELITRAFSLANQKKAVVPVVMSRDSVRLKTGGRTAALKRQDVLLVQTPQVFDTSLLKLAYLQPFNDEFTDDASVVEAMGADIFTIEGDYKNIKITYPEDLRLAEVLIKS